MNNNQNNNQQPENFVPPNNCRPNPVKHVLFGFVILFAGMVIGSASTIIIIKQAAIRPPVRQMVSDKIVHGIRQKLNLTEDQSKAIDPIIKKHFNRLDEIKANARPLIESVIAQMHEEISGILTDEQAKQWEKQIKRLEKGFGSRRRMHDRGFGDHDHKKRKNKNREGKQNRKNPPLRKGSQPPPMEHPFEYEKEMHLPEVLDHQESNASEIHVE